MPFTRQLLLMQIAVVLVVVGVGFGLVAWLVNNTLDREFERRALAVADTVAADPAVAAAVVARDQPQVQALALRSQHATGALFVVVTNDRGIRLAHPNPDEIGKEVSTSPDEALHGRDVVNIERGTLGLSARGKVPLRDARGAIVGEVSVGFDASEITTAVRHLMLRAALFFGCALLLGIAGSALLTRLLKRRTFGLEPSEVAELVREREAVLYAVSDGVLAVDTAGHVTMVNDEAVRLLDQDVVIGGRVGDLAVPPHLREAMTTSSSGGVVAAVGARVLVVKRRDVARDGRELGCVLTLIDRTEIEQLTDELHAVRMLTQALRAQRHEFANRLHTVHGLLQTAETGDAAEYVAALVDSAEFSRIDDAGRIASATIRALLAGKTAEAAEVGVRLGLSEQSWLPHRLLAPVEVVTVLGNLVNNAVEAAAASAHGPAWVEVDLLADRDVLLMSVADSGDGIAADHLDRIFVDGVSSRGEGRGLGLAISRDTVEALGGSLVVANAGGGTPTVLLARMPNVLAAEQPSARWDGPAE